MDKGLSEICTMRLSKQAFAAHVRGTLCSHGNGCEERVFADLEKCLFYVQRGGGGLGKKPLARAARPSRSLLR